MIDAAAWDVAFSLDFEEKGFPAGANWRARESGGPRGWPSLDSLCMSCNGLGFLMSLGRDSARVHHHETQHQGQHECSTRKNAGPSKRTNVPKESEQSVRTRRAAQFHNITNDLLNNEQIFKQSLGASFSPPGTTISKGRRKSQPPHIDPEKVFLW